MKDSLEGFAGRCERTEERISEFKDRTMKILKSEEQRRKRLKKNTNRA